MEMQFTADGVRAASFADMVRRSVGGGEGGFATVEEVLEEFADSPEDLEDNRALYLAGMQVLKQARLAESGRTVAVNIALAHVPETAISPGVLFESGYIGTSQVYRAVWLEPRQQPVSLDFVTPGEAAVLTGTAESGWRNRASAGKIPGAVKKGKQWLIPRAAISK